jgi:hypothetical protein
MSFNPDLQYRCTIIRGKAKQDIDNLLPSYAEILDRICPCNKLDFRRLFNKELQHILHVSSEKTLDNHRTEIVGKLFGMYYIDGTKIVHISERAVKLLKDGDQPAFFKDMCYKMQFPNGMDKPPKLLRDIANKIKIRQCIYTITVLDKAEKSKTILSRGEVGCYVLNALEVLQGKITPDEVLQTIIRDRSQGIRKRIRSNGKAKSYTHQHINETINYLELANLVKSEGEYLYLNSGEAATISLMASLWDSPLLFDMYKYNLNSKNGRDSMYFEWQLRYSQTDDSLGDIFNTPLKAIVNGENPIIKEMISGTDEDLQKLGDDGELYVYNFEKQRIRLLNIKLINKVLLLGKTKGLGFDIQSVRAVAPNPEFATYIEVKSTKRVTEPSGDLQDSVTLTRNEWVAAAQHKDDYFIYRVYFTPDNVFIYRITNPVGKSEKGIIEVTPLTYRLDFLVKICDVVR